MAFFIDGPAKAQTFDITRHPPFIRVTEAVEQGGEVKLYALDQIEDTVGENETPCVYRRCGESVCFIDYTDRVTKKRRGRRVVMVNYKLHHEQPPREVLADNGRWQKWCLATWQKEKADGPEEVLRGELPGDGRPEAADVRPALAAGAQGPPTGGVEALQGRPGE